MPTNLLHHGSQNRIQKTSRNMAARKVLAFEAPLFSDVGPLESIAENKTEQKSAAKRRQRSSSTCVFPQRGAYS